MEILSTVNSNIYKIKGEESNFKTLYVDNKVWLNTKDISNLFWISEMEWAKYIKEIFFDSDLDISYNLKRQYNKYLDWYDNYYSLDLIISLWYRLRSYNKTKFLINTTNEIKKYIENYNSNRESRASKLNKRISLISNAHNIN